MSGIEELLREIRGERDLQREVAHHALLPARAAELADSPVAGLGARAPARLPSAASRALRPPGARPRSPGGGARRRARDGHREREDPRLPGARPWLRPSRSPAPTPSSCFPCAPSSRTSSSGCAPPRRRWASRRGRRAGAWRSTTATRRRAERRRLRERPPAVLITTPDMLHAGILPSHGSWQALLPRRCASSWSTSCTPTAASSASHVAQVLRRLERVAAHHGARPQLVAASATVANPGELAARAHRARARRRRAATARRAPRATCCCCSPARLGLHQRRAPVPPRGAQRPAHDRLHQGARASPSSSTPGWRSRSPALRERITAYRAGYLAIGAPRDRALPLRGASSLGVISTSALELGIDVGDLDVCILVGYPGSQIASWQRSRARRAARGTGLVALVAGADALDQYLVAHPERFLAGRFEHAVARPRQRGDRRRAPGLRRRRAARCAPASPGSPSRASPPGLRELEESGAPATGASRGASGSPRAAVPHRDVDLRAAGASCAIVLDGAEGERAREIGSIGVGRVFAECHEGAIYLHRGPPVPGDASSTSSGAACACAPSTCRSTRARSPRRRPRSSRGSARGPSATSGCSTAACASPPASRATSGAASTARICSRPSPSSSRRPASRPRLSGSRCPRSCAGAVEARDGHFMGGIHAVEHAALALCPLFALCDRHDVAGISYARHPQLGRPAIFLYDGHPGGAGLAPGLFERVEALLEATLELVADCDCEEGCPSCVHSPKCGSGNRPIDKRAARQRARAAAGARSRSRERGGARRAPRPRARFRSRRPGRRRPPDVVFFDLETQRARRSRSAAGTTRT